MALINYNGRFCEQDFENALVQMFVDNGWEYLFGDNIERSSGTEVLIADDIRSFIEKQYSFLNPDEVSDIVNKISLAGGETQFATMHNIYTMLVDGITFTTADGTPHIINFIDYDNAGNNTFKVVNQFTVDYVNNNQRKNRRPDILLYVNGIPICIIELKNPTKTNTTILDAYKQITIRYWRDIPHLLHYCPLAVISDGVKTRLGTVLTPYEHFYAWRRVENEDKNAGMGFAEVETMVKGVFAPTRLLEIFRDYVYFQDRQYDHDEYEIVCRYPQFFATRLLRESIQEAVITQSGKGGTYFGATGCGKTYTMAFLSRQLALRCSQVLGSPTVVMIVDRDDLQNQGAQLFTKSAEFLSLGEVRIIDSRKDLRQELGARPSGGFYVCTIQKFCDRATDKIGLINDRSNIICFSDEAHRSQIERSRQIKFEGSETKNMRALISKPYAKVLREAFPHATFVGFTGTPVAETYQTFGAEVDRYTMDQAVADGITVPIKYHPRITKVLLDKEKVKLIEEYYKKCADEGASEEDVRASKKAMSSMEVILGEPDRLRHLAADIYSHFSQALDADPSRRQKAMIVCSERKIAYNLLMQFKEQFPQWFEEQKSPWESELSKEALDKLKPMPTIAMVATIGKDDPKDMSDYLGGVANSARNKELDARFKQPDSNFRIAIVVDMWITGFDVPCLTYLYNDKPLQKHTLIQTISRVNRKDKNKDYGVLIDYIGIRDNMIAAMKTYGGFGESLEPSEDDIAQAYSILQDQLAILKQLFINVDLTAFLSADSDPTVRYQKISRAADFVFSNPEMLYEADVAGVSKKVTFKTFFLATAKRLRVAYNVCQPSNILSSEELPLSQCFMAIAGFVQKMSGTSVHDTDSMNRAVAKMVEEALKYNKVVSILDAGEEEDIFDPTFEGIVAGVAMPATKLELLIKMLRRRIAEYGKTNAIAAKKYQDMLEKTIEQYHERRKHLDLEEAGATQEEATIRIIQSAIEQALDLLKGLNVDRESFRQMGLTFEEKAFYDILIHLRDEHNFEYGTDSKYGNDKCKDLAKKIREIIDTKSAYSDWLNNQRVRESLKLEIKLCLIKNKYPPEYSPVVFQQIMNQVENFKENND